MALGAGERAHIQFPGNFPIVFCMNLDLTRPRVRLKARPSLFLRVSSTSFSAEPITERQIHLTLASTLNWEWMSQKAEIRPGDSGINKCKIEEPSRISFDFKVRHWNQNKKSIKNCTHTNDFNGLSSRHYRHLLK